MALQPGPTLALESLQEYFSSKAEGCAETYQFPPNICFLGLPH